MKTPLRSLLILTIFIAANLHAQVFVKLVKEINPTGDSQPYSFTVAGGKLFFVAYDGTATRLVVTQGDSNSTKVLGPATGLGNIYKYLVAFKNKVYFICDDNVHGTELWVSDGTAAGTTMLNDIYPGSTSSYPQNLTVAGDKLVFIAINEDGAYRLFATDGTSAGTHVIRNNYSHNFNGVQPFVTLGNKILFSGDDGSNNGQGMFITDGTAAGTTLVKGNFAASNAAGNSVTINGKVYFAGGDDNHGIELWATDGTNAGTYMVKNISPDPGGGVYGNSTPQGFCAYKGKLYFSATDGTTGQELWVSDGTEAGTQLLKDIVPGATGSLPYHSIVYNNKLYTICWGSNELWVSDGTAAGTQKVASLNESMQFAAIWHNLLYLESPGQPAVWQSDGTTAGTHAMQANNYTNQLVYHYGNDAQFTEYNSELYLSGSVYPLTKGYEPIKLTTQALPLTLVQFNGQVQKDDDVLSWQTTNEINTAYFEVQQGQPGNSFVKAGTVTAAGNSSTMQNYTYRQSSITNPGGYYRLKMVDKDGAATYSRIIQLARASAAKLNAFYNNGTHQVIIQNNTSGLCNWQLYSPGGSLVKKGASAGGTIAIPTSGMAGAVYILTCQSAAGSSKFTLPVF